MASSWTLRRSNLSPVVRIDSIPRLMEYKPTLAATKLTKRLDKRPRLPEAFSASFEMFFNPARLKLFEASLARLVACWKAADVSRISCANRCCCLAIWRLESPVWLRPVRKSASFSRCCWYDWLANTTALRADSNRRCRVLVGFSACWYSRANRSTCPCASRKVRPASRTVEVCF